MLSQENNTGGAKNDLLFASSLRLLLTPVFNDNYFELLLRKKQVSLFF